MKTAKDYLQEANEVVQKIDVKEAIEKVKDDNFRQLERWQNEHPHHQDQNHLHLILKHLMHHHSNYN